MTATATTRWAMSPEVRTELYAWAQGVQKVIIANTKYAVTNLSNQALRRAKWEGYLVQVGRDWRGPYERTDKVLRPYRPQQRQPYVGLFPWSIKEHWQVLQSHGTRLQLNVTRQLQGLPPRRRWYFSVRNAEVLIENRTQLIYARRELVHLFQGNAEPASYHQKHITLCFQEPLLLQHLLEDMRVTPEFDAGGKFTRFCALPPDAWATGLTGYANVFATFQAGALV